MNDCPDCLERERELELRERNRMAYSNYYFRLAQFHRDVTFPDGRSDDMKARGMTIEWKRRVIFNEQRRAERRFQQRVAAARQEAIERWNGTNVTDIRDARR